MQELFIVFRDKENIGYITLYTNKEDLKMYLILSELSEFKFKEIITIVN